MTPHDQRPRRDLRRDATNLAITARIMIAVSALSLIWLALAQAGAITDVPTWWLTIAAAASGVALAYTAAMRSRRRHLEREHDQPAH